MGLPHVRGGVSEAVQGLQLTDQSSPRAWGCFRKRQSVVRLTRVFPTCVGVFPVVVDGVGYTVGLPHVRGGVSCSSGRRRVYRWSSPRAWGCFHDPPAPQSQAPVFPTCVGVFLSSLKRPRYSGRLPHVRGGVSNSPGQLKPPYPSSPRAWGCFLVC